jgi:hypothetical protein
VTSASRVAVVLSLLLTTSGCVGFQKRRDLPGPYCLAERSGGSPAFKEEVNFSRYYVCEGAKEDLRPLLQVWDCVSLWWDGEVRGHMYHGHDLDGEGRLRSAALLLPTEGQPRILTWPYGMTMVSLTDFQNMNDLEKLGFPDPPTLIAAWRVQASIDEPAYLCHPATRERMGRIVDDRQWPDRLQVDPMAQKNIRFTGHWACFTIERSDGQFELWSTSPTKRGSVSKFERLGGPAATVEEADWEGEKTLLERWIAALQR